MYIQGWTVKCNKINHQALNLLSIPSPKLKVTLNEFHNTFISVATGGGKEGQLPPPPTGPGLDPEIWANPMRSVNT